MEALPDPNAVSGNACDRLLGVGEEEYCSRPLQVYKRAASLYCLPSTALFEIEPLILKNSISIKLLIMHFIKLSAVAATLMAFVAAVPVRENALAAREPQRKYEHKYEDDEDNTLAVRAPQRKYEHKYEDDEIAKLAVRKPQRKYEHKYEDDEDATVTVRDPQRKYEHKYEEDE